MGKLVQVASIDRETRRRIFDAVAWLLGIVMAAVLVAEAAANGRSTEPPAYTASTGEHATCHRPAERYAQSWY